MSRTPTNGRPSSEAAIFARVWESGADGFSPEIARHVLGLEFCPADKARMHELAEKNQEGRISAGELEELDHYVKVADLLALLQSRARKVLKPTRTRRHG
jgi:hypothetical protein